MISFQTKNKSLDAICLGRAGVDLYANEHFASFTEVERFNKFVGGSPALIAIGLATLGASVGFIGAVSEDGLGRYVRNYLNQKGINTDGLAVAPQGTRTSLAITEMSPDSPEVVIYRNNAADLALQPGQVSEAYVASARLLLVSGTALSAKPSRQAALTAMQMARKHETKVVLDIDYRNYSWESPEIASRVYSQAASLSDILIGNREEYAVVQGVNVIEDELTGPRFLQPPTELVIVKDGERGCRVFTPYDQFDQRIFPVKAQKPFGAGDAFAGSMLFGLLNDYPLKESVAMGAAAAAINVADTNCSEAMPTLEALQAFMAEQRNA